MEKSPEKLVGDDIPLGDRKNMVYLGSTVVYGHGRAVVTGTGMNTEMGKIAGVLAQAGSGQTPLQRKLSELSKNSHLPGGGYLCGHFRLFGAARRKADL